MSCRILSSRLKPICVSLSLCLWILLGYGLPATAGQVEVVHTRFKKAGDTWTVSTTLKHSDTGWDHYADAWRVVDEAGKELGKRVLHHPHEQEQPFTRSLSGLNIPATMKIVYVEAHDKVHGWNAQRVRVDLQQPKGERFDIQP